jgi:CHAT domain-containing protein
MVVFHRALVAGRPQAEALGAAFRELLADPRYRHPFYGAAFSLMGAGD